MMPCPPILLVEGPQGSGKTTLIRALMSRLPNTVVLKKTPASFQGTSPLTQAVAAYHADVDLLTAAASLSTVAESVLLDRAFLSNIVYSTLRTQRAELVTDLYYSDPIQEQLRRLHDLRGRMVIVMNSQEFSQTSDRLKSPEWIDWRGLDRSFYAELAQLVRADFPLIEVVNQPVTPGGDPGLALFSSFMGALE